MWSGHCEGFPVPPSLPRDATYASPRPLENRISPTVRVSCNQMDRESSPPAPHFSALGWKWGGVADPGDADGMLLP